MSAHTPGPWTIEPSWEDRFDGAVSIVNREHAGDDWDVCLIASSAANARLISAAPDLLATLKSIASTCRNCGGSGVIELVGVKYECDAGHCAIARAAIAKATGK